MDKIVFGDLSAQGIEVVERKSKLYVRYDAGSHQEALREDEITVHEFHQIKKGGKSQNKAMFGIQERLEKSDISPHAANWKK